MRSRTSSRRPSENDLRQSFALLLIAESRLSIVEIAAQLGHHPTVCLDIYGHVMAERGGEADRRTTDRRGTGQPLITCSEHASMW
jgi:integrase